MIPISKRRLLVCPICNWNREVPKASEHVALEMIGITESWKAHQLADDEYSRRVDAFWSFMSGSGADSATPDGPGGASQAPPIPPAPPAWPDQPPAPPSAG